MSRCLLLRADASAQIGTGHLMRCLALAQAWQDAGRRAVFLMATETPSLELRLQLEGVEVVHLSVQPGSVDDAIQTAKFAHQVGAGCVVVDGYHFDAEYQRIIKYHGLHLLFIDDTGHAEYYYADFVLNQNIYAHEGLYKNREPYTRLLLGKRYVILRREFLKWRGWKREIPKTARKVLVTMGGSDPNNVTLKVIQALQQVDIDSLETITVVGGSNPHYVELQSVVQNGLFPIRLESNVTNMPALMAWADIAISAGGSTIWELAFMGLPALVLTLAENQRMIAEHLDAMGVVVNLGWYKNLSSDMIAQTLLKFSMDIHIRSSMYQQAKYLVDGNGTLRVIEALESLFDAKFSLRPVQDADCKLIWMWSNDPDVRSASFSQKKIRWEDHVQWFKSKLADPSCIFLIAVNEHGNPIGSVRFDINKESNDAVISVTIDQKYRGKGFGSKIIRSASQRLCNIFNIDTINAYIKHGNIPSIQAFSRAGYNKIGITEIYGNKTLHMIFKEETLECKMEK